MSEAVVELEIKNLKGLHARAAADVDVTVEKDGQKVDGSSIVGLMMLAASKGSRIKVTADGTDAEQAVQNISDLVNSLFGEEQ